MIYEILRGEKLVVSIIIGYGRQRLEFLRDNM